MRLTKLLPVLAAVSLAGCLNANLDGVSIGGWQPDPNGRYGKFTCDNGYRVSIKYRSPQQISLQFFNGKDTFIDYADGGNGSYANPANTLRWQERGSGGVLTYPASDYRSSARLLETNCRAR